MADKTRVAKYQADRTNQKLYFCRLACQEADSTNDKQVYQAHCETAIFHLYGTFLAFLQELGYFYNITLAAPTLADIEEVLSERTQVSPEIQRLKQLQQQGLNLQKQPMQHLAVFLLMVQQVQFQQLSLLWHRMLVLH